MKLIELSREKLKLAAKLYNVRTELGIKQAEARKIIRPRE